MKKLFLLSLLFVSSIQPSHAWSKAKLSLGVGALSAVILGTGVLIMDKYRALEIMLCNQQFFAARLLLRLGLLRIQDNPRYFTKCLHDAVFMKDEEIVKFLLENGVDVNSKSLAGLAAIHYALHLNQSISMLQLLLKFGADLSIKDQHNNPLLHYAVKSLGMNTDKIQLLLDSGVDISSEDNQGRTALCYAHFCSKKDAIILLNEALIKQQNLRMRATTIWSHLTGTHGQGLDENKKHANPLVTARVHQLLQGR